MLLSPTFIILDITDAYIRTTRGDRAGLLNRNILDSLEDVPQAGNVTTRMLLEASLQHVRQHREPHTMDTLTFEIPLPAAQGGGTEERFWHTSHTPVFDQQGELAYILHETRDITEQVRLEQEKIFSREQLTLLSTALDAVAWEYDIVHNKMHWGQGLQEVFGYTPEEMGPGGESWDDRVHPADFPAIRDSINQATASGSKIWSGEYRFRKADGTYTHVLDQGYIVYDSNRKPIRTIGSIIDLAKSKRAEDSLQESQDRFRHLLEILPHMAWTADAKGRVTYFNDNWYSYTGMPPGQTDGWVNMVHPEDTAQLLTAWSEAIALGTMYEQEYRIRNCLDGSYHYFLERAMPMFDNEGKVKMWIGTFTDIEDQRHTVEQLDLKDQQLHNILNLSPAHLCLLHGPEHMCQYVTPGVYQLYGNRRYLGLTARQIWPELQPLGFFDLLDQVYQKGDTVQLTELKIPIDRYQNGKPENAYFNFKYQPLLDNKGEREGVLISAIEVTELVEMKRKAAALEKELQQRS